MKGYKHTVWLDASGGIHEPGVVHQGVAMANNDDDFYYCLFESREEVEDFIAELRAAADQKWGSQP